MTRNVSASLYNLAAMLAAGASPAKALRGVGLSDRDERLERAADLIDRGLSLASALEHERAYPETALRLIRLGEERDEVVAMTRKAAELLTADEALRQAIVAAQRYPKLVNLGLAATAVGAFLLWRVRGDRSSS